MLCSLQLKRIFSFMPIVENCDLIFGRSFLLKQTPSARLEQTTTLPKLSPNTKTM